MWCETVEPNHAEMEVITLPHSPRTAVLNGAVPKSRIEAARETRGRKMPVKSLEESIFWGIRFGDCVASVLSLSAIPLIPILAQCLF